MQALGRRVDWRDAARAGGWLAVTAAVLGALVAVVGADAVLRELRGADRRLAAGVGVLALLTVALRGVGFRVVLAAVGERRPLARAVALYAAMTFVNRVTPSGQAGGAAVDGLLAVRVLDVRYETGLAAVLSANALNNVVILALGLVGAGALAATGAGADLWLAAATAGALLAGILGGLVALWRFPGAARTLAVRTLTPLARLVGRALPGVVVPGRAAVADRVDGFGADLGRLGRAPRAVVVVLALSLGARLVRTAALWLAFQAVGLSVSPALLLAVTPAAMAAAAAPIPGGGGGVETVLVGLVAAATGLPAATVTAGVLVFRGVSYWLEVLVGGATAGGLLAATE
jgi:uncharacterized membrane protein YbhN (UPF0104 family)